MCQIENSLLYIYEMFKILRFFQKKFIFKAFPDILSINCQIQVF